MREIIIWTTNRYSLLPKLDDDLVLSILHRLQRCMDFEIVHPKHRHRRCWIWSSLSFEYMIQHGLQPCLDFGATVVLKIPLQTVLDRVCVPYDPTQFVTVYWFEALRRKHRHRRCWNWSSLSENDPTRFATVFGFPRSFAENTVANGVGSLTRRFYDGDVKGNLQGVLAEIENWVHLYKRMPR